MATTPYMFASVPATRPSLRAAYEAWLKAQTPLGTAEPAAAAEGAPPLPPNARVGIIGGGMAGLYSALLLQGRGVQVKVLEANPTRLGGRVYTHRFTADPNQYFEAGAMRLPNIHEQKPVFDLIEVLNEKVSPQLRITTIPYVLYDDTGDRVFVNGGPWMTIQTANRHPENLGFPLQGPDRLKTATKLLDGVIGPFLKLLKDDFEKGFEAIVKYDNWSLHAYLAQVHRWSEDMINYAEVMTSQTNQFQNSFTELIIENMDFGTAKWMTIENGMDRLPNACAALIGRQNILMGAAVYRLEELANGKVAVYHKAATEPEIFDRVIAAVPPAVIRMWQTPQWSVPKEQAIRSLHFEALYKIGLRFKTRFWEKVAKPARGGQSTTDLPSRWFVYPSYGIGDNGPGVLLLYAWMSDALGWLPQSEDDRVRIALRDLARVYGGEVDVAAQFIEAQDVAWPLEWATGDAMFFPGQFRQLFNVARQPEGNVYFAGEHLSVHHTWIVGALDSALHACQQLLQSPDLPPLRPRHRQNLPPHTYDYGRCAKAKALVVPGRPAGLPAPASASARRWRFE